MSEPQRPALGEFAPATADGPNYGIVVDDAPLDAVHAGDTLCAECTVELTHVSRALVADGVFDATSTETLEPQPWVREQIDAALADAGVAIHSYDDAHFELASDERAKVCAIAFDVTVTAADDGGDA